MHFDEAIEQKHESIICVDVLTKKQFDAVYE